MARKRYTKGTKIKPNLYRTSTGRIAMNAGQAARRAKERAEEEARETELIAMNAGKSDRRRQEEEKETELIAMNAGQSARRRQEEEKAKEKAEAIAEKEAAKNKKQNTTPAVDTGEPGRDNPVTPSPFTGTTAETASSEAQREREFRADESGKRMEQIPSNRS